MEERQDWRPRAKYVNLYLSEKADPAVDEAGRDKEDRSQTDAASARLELHAFIQRKLRQGVILRDASAYKEARLWLGSTLGLLEADSRTKRRHFLPFQRSSYVNHK